MLHTCPAHVGQLGSKELVQAPAGIFIAYIKGDWKGIGHRRTTTKDTKYHEGLPHISFAMLRVVCGDLSGCGQGSRSRGTPQPQHPASDHQQNGDQLGSGHGAAKDFTAAGIVTQEFEEVSGEAVEK